MGLNLGDTHDSACLMSRSYPLTTVVGSGCAPDSNLSSVTQPRTFVGPFQEEIIFLTVVTNVGGCKAKDAGDHPLPM